MSVRKSVPPFRANGTFERNRIMIVAVCKETFPGERRVAMAPSVVPSLVKKKIDVLVEAGAGVPAGFTDEEFAQRGATIAPSRAEALAKADVVLQVRGLGANPEAGQADLAQLRPSQVIIGMMDPLWNPSAAQELAQTGVTAFAMELMPRITRAQSMDVLSSMATVTGYKAVLLAAERLPRLFPMMMTAAGTLSPAHVFVIGAGVAGLQAIATARRLGAVVFGYDVRPVVKEQVESLGAKFVEMELEAGDTEARGGYARAMGEEFYRKQRELLTRVVAENEVVITTALVPGARAPVLISAEMVRGMRPGSVVVDLAADYGGNCELTRPGETVVENEVAVIGPSNLASSVPYHASQMYARNLATFLLHLVKDGSIALDADDEITQQTLICREGEVKHSRLRELLDLQSGASRSEEAT